MTDVFISYSRQDAEFIRQLFDILNSQHRDAWVDWRDIDYSTQWWEEICAGIEGADNFVLVISPNALTSVYCHREIEYARKHAKRIIPLIYKPLDEATLVGGWYTHPDFKAYEALARDNWEALKAIQWIDYPRLGDLNSAISALLETVDTDPERVKLHTQLLLRMREWESRGRSPSTLLRGADLVMFEHWRDDSSAKGSQPQPTEEQRTYITASRRGENARQRNQVVAVIISLLLLVAAGVFAVVGSLAQGRADAANAQVAAANTTLTPLLATLDRKSTRL